MLILFDALPGCYYILFLFTISAPLFSRALCLPASSKLLVY